MVSLIIETETVNLWRIASHVDTQAKPSQFTAVLSVFSNNTHLDGTSIAGTRPYKTVSPFC